MFGVGWRFALLLCFARAPFVVFWLHIYFPVVLAFPPTLLCLFCDVATRFRHHSVIFCACGCVVVAAAVLAVFWLRCSVSVCLGPV